MAKRDVDYYYEKITADYTEMVHTLEDMQNEGVAEENIEQVKQQVEILKQNFQRWSYMMFLLNKPQRKQKEAAYIKRNKKLLKLTENNTIDDVIEENNSVIISLKNIKNC